ALALAGCAADNEPLADPDAAIAEADTTPIPTIDPIPETTPEQWASVIAVEKNSWEEWHEDWDGECDYFVTNTEGDFLCGVQLLSAYFQAQTTSLNIDGMTNPDGLKRIADEPPAEIADIYADALADSKSLEEHAMSWYDAGCSNA